MSERPPTECRSLVLYHDGVEALERGGLDAALECFERSWALDEHAATAHRLAQTLGALGRADEAHAWLERAFRLNPRNAQIASAWAGALVAQQRLTDARRVLAETLGHTPTYGPARELLASLR